MVISIEILDYFNGANCDDLSDLEITEILNYDSRGWLGNLNRKKKLYIEIQRD